MNGSNLYKVEHTYHYKNEYSPFYINFGRHPVDLFFGSEAGHKDYVQKCFTHMQETSNSIQKCKEVCIIGENIS